MVRQKKIFLGPLLKKFAHHCPIQWAPGLSRGVKRPGRGIDHPSTFKAEVKGIELYVYSLTGFSWRVIG